LKCFEQDIAIKKDILDKLEEMYSIENKLESAILSIYDIIDGKTDSFRDQYRGKETAGVTRELEKVLLILQEQLRKLQDGELDNEMF
tara:strand:- start:17 stop:277 length:261 start_codon:yes stop_codon:yes gene_type:complete